MIDLGFIFVLVFFGFVISAFILTEVSYYPALLGAKILLVFSILMCVYTLVAYQIGEYKEYTEYKAHIYDGTAMINVDGKLINLNTIGHNFEEGQTVYFWKTKNSLGINFGRSGVSLTQD